jgi:hypothetical protein
VPDKTTTTHAAVVSARVGGHSRNDVRIDKDMVGRRPEKPAATIRCSISTPSSGSTLTVGVTDGRCVVEVKS